MSKFHNFKKAMQDHITNMIENKERLYITDVDKDLMWEIYLESFPEGTNPIYKERREYDCNGCKQFIRQFGNVVVIDENKLISIWDIPNAEYPFNVVSEKLSSFVKTSIKDVYLAEQQKIGVDSNKQQLEDNTVCTWEHLFYKLPKKFVNTSSKSIPAVVGAFRDSKNVFMRSMKELTLEAGETIIDLIDQGSIYRGEEHKSAVLTFIKYKKMFDKVSVNEQENWCWENSVNNPICRIKNNAIGTLLEDISEELDLDTAVSKFEKIMAPANYKRPKAIFTKKMVEEAQKKIKELGYENSLGRRHAKITDVTVNNVLFADRDAKKAMDGGIFDSLMNEVSTNPKSFSKVEEVKIEDFVEKILPNISSMEMLIENRHRGNFMSVVAPIDKDAPSMLKWNNNFSWSYNGDVADSMKQNVKNAGGDIDGVLRFSIQWNDGDNNQNDFDAHCIEPCGNHIYFGEKRNTRTTGKLDVDIQRPGSRVAVENITWTDISKMGVGRYEFFVENYSHNGGRTGFTAEVEFDGQIYSFSYDKELRQKEKVYVATVELGKGGSFKLVKSLDGAMSSAEIWGVNTNQFSKVNLMMYSPNYWDEQTGTGNRHYFFIVPECKTETSPRGFYNEFLDEKLMEHKRVFEALSGKMKVEDSDEQLSGLGFSSTQRNDIIVKVNGNFSRTIKLVF